MEQKTEGKPLNLKKLLNSIGAAYSGPGADITLITHRMDEVTDGALFVCIRGAHADGHDFAQQAMQNGAAAVVCERDTAIPEQVIVADSRRALALLSAAFYGHPSEQLVLLGVTGTNGKTTTACWIRSILEQAQCKTALIGTLGADCGGGMTQTGHTTPDAVVLHRTLRESVESGCEYAVAEISSQALSQERCAGIGFDVAVFTNLSPEHLDYHKTMDAYAAEKVKLFEAAKTAVVNRDDEYASLILSHCKGRVLTFSLDDDADLTAKNIKYSADGVRCIFVSRDGIERVHLHSPGVTAVYNAMAAVSACVAVGIDFEEACRFVCNAPVVPGRLQKIQTQAPFSLYVDYAHTPAAMYEALYALRQITEGRLIAVFGCGGDRDAYKRPQMGEIASALADITILTNDNPRTEAPQKILSEIAVGFKSKKELLIFEDRREAISTALQKAQPGDCVLLAGKGHETTQQTADGEAFFDNAQVARELITVYYA